MIVLDTNVVSELMQSSPDPLVVDWLNAQPSESIWTTSVCVFEILYGLNTMTRGKRRQSLQEAFDQALQQDMEGRVLDFDAAARGKLPRSQPLFASREGPSRYATCKSLASSPRDVARWPHAIQGTSSILG